MRKLEEEHADTPDRKYAYDFDYRMHGYMMRTFAPFSGRTALEMGCFKGEFTKRILEHFDSVTVAEGAADLIEEARNAIAPSKATFVKTRFEEFAPPEGFDAIFLIHTLEHLDVPQDVLRRVRTWLNATGRFFVAVPNAYAASRQIAVAMGLISHPTAVTDGEYAHGHRRTYSLAALVEEMEAAGFKVERSGGIFFKPFANFQFDRLISSGAVDDAYLEGCYRLGERYPELCASIFAICSNPGEEHEKRC